MTNPISFPSSTAAFAAATSAIRPSADPSSTPATSVQQTASSGSGGAADQQTPQTHQEVQFDKSGLTVVMTYDVTNGGLVSQYPTEAYLRLANAMQNVIRHEDPESGTNRTA